MKHESVVDTDVYSDFGRKTEDFTSLLNQYADLFVGSLFAILGGMLAIYLIHRIAAKFLFPHFHKGRLIKTAGLAVYALILLATAVIILAGIGVDVTGITRIALVTIFVITVLTFFLLPLLPKLPFQVGHMLEVGGELGTVVTISPLFTGLKTNEGELVFVPNTSIIRMVVKNYSFDAFRRIDINLSVQSDIGLEQIKSTLIKLMTEDERVLEEPSKPAVYVLNANADYIELLAVCWVSNEDWLTTKSDLWEKIVNTADEGVQLAKPCWIS